jgi:hypothetical protein
MATNIGSSALLIQRRDLQQDTNTINFNNFYAWLSVTICYLAEITAITDNCNYKRKVKLSLQQAVEVHRIVRCQDSHIF